ncbi:periplasmic binding protein [Beutenbergia cavernae DSM 12333]|uniref:Periplasmic binding protein n=1 Tax=Beutenbergia cavernae (strain ATCC BAA-8 / DSM 12333 / CCUG 43141 / JCM 11478 / NBRC 16432 / NCIMB 13614 / HKI 0122) TaxID=471853 RepID=C5BXE4_BEUC1|nr:putative F420-0 ABC transporter substrate-binding protein [Beutenbergia cavernae]ACQ80827.1 periplasmic binding protein [Beutenbergia cavernae DSM 12333]
MPILKSPRARRSWFAGALAVGALALAACGGGASADPNASASEEQAAADYAAFTADNCGTDVAVDAAPQRIVTIKSSTTELVLALGAGDRIVGTAYPDGPVPDEYADVMADVPVLSDRVPSHEAVLELEPDLVYAGWESNLAADGAGERSSFSSLGITTFVSPSACQEPGYQPDPLTFDDVFAEIEQVGALLGEPDAAADLVEEQRAALSDVTPSDAGLSAVWYSSGSDTPFVGAGIGAPQMVMDAAGLENIAADVHDTWTSLSWEAVADAEPDVIVLVDSEWNTAENKIEVLESNPVTAALPAVQDARYVVVPFAATEAGVRSVDAARTIADQLADLEG